MGRRARWDRNAAAAAALLAMASAVPLASAHPFRAQRSGLAVNDGPTVGSPRVPTHGPHLGSHGSTVIADRWGVLVAERNAGALIRSDAEGRPVARLDLHLGLGQIVSPREGVVFVADQAGDRVLAVRTDGAERLEVTAEASMASPHGLATTPDGETLLVTSITDQALVALDTASMKERWRAPLRPEPRAVAVSSDGREATVGFLSTGALAVVDLAAAGRQVRWQPLDPRDHVEVVEVEDEWEGSFKVAEVKEARSRFEVPTDTGRRHARNVFGVAYVGGDLVAAPHQLSTPQMKRIPTRDMQDSYGGGPEAVPPIVHRLALVDGLGDAGARVGFSRLGVHQPRALAYDAARDILYVAGYGDDRFLALADVSQPTAYEAWSGTELRPAKNRECGPDGIAVRGEHVWVHCELTRSLIRLTPSELRLDDKSWVTEKSGLAVGPELAPTLRSEEVERGAELFRRGRDWRISDGGVMACSSCHPDGRQDGLSWRLGKSILQTPMLAGRLEGTAPYKWNGEDPTLTASFKHTLERLGGHPEEFRGSELDALVAYVTSLRAPAAPSHIDAQAAARGKVLFEKQLDCTGCHDGDKLTDGGQYPLASRGLDVTDTPSLVGLAHTAPYYHDGSAPDLYTLVRDRGSVHDMSDFSTLNDAQARDLVAYLQTL